MNEWENIDYYGGRLKEYEILDSDLWWDPYCRTGFSSCVCMDEFMSGLQSAHISGGVVTNIESVATDPYYGNERLACAIAPHGNLYGCMVLTPEAAQDGESYIKGLLERKFVMARMFPASYRHSMKKYCVGGLLELLERLRLPLMLWHSQVSWDTMDEICQAYPNLPVIVEGHDVKLLYHSRNYLALLAAHPNFYIETHNLVLFDEIKCIVSRFGATRLVFGSYYPYHAPGHALFSIAASETGYEDKKSIFGANLNGLIGAIKR